MVCIISLGSGAKLSVIMVNGMAGIIRGSRWPILPMLAVSPTTSAWLSLRGGLPWLTISRWSWALNAATCSEIVESHLKMVLKGRTVPVLPSHRMYISFNFRISLHCPLLIVIAAVAWLLIASSLQPITRQLSTYTFWNVLQYTLILVATVAGTRFAAACR